MLLKEGGERRRRPSRGRVSHGVTPSKAYIQKKGIDNQFVFTQFWSNFFTIFINLVIGTNSRL